MYLYKTPSSSKPWNYKSEANFSIILGVSVMSSQSVTKLQEQNNGAAVGLDFGTMYFPETSLTIFQLTLVGGGWPPQVKDTKKQGIWTNQLVKEIYKVHSNDAMDSAWKEKLFEFSQICLFTSVNVDSSDCSANS